MHVLARGRKARKRMRSAAACAGHLRRPVGIRPQAADTGYMRSDTRCIFQKHKEKKSVILLLSKAKETYYLHILRMDWRCMSNLSSEERRSAILELLAGEASVQVAQLAEMFGVSRVTIRSDLDALAHDGKLRRTRGGAISLSKTLTVSVRPPRQRQRCREARYRTHRCALCARRRFGARGLRYHGARIRARAFQPHRGDHRDGRFHHR